MIAHQEGFGDDLAVAAAAAAAASVFGGYDSGGGGGGSGSVRVAKRDIPDRVEVQYSKVGQRQDMQNRQIGRWVGQAIEAFGMFESTSNVGRATAMATACLHVVPEKHRINSKTLYFPPQIHSIPH